MMVDNQISKAKSFHIIAVKNLWLFWFMYLQSDFFLPAWP